MPITYPRDLIRITARDALGNPVSDAYWSDVGARAIDVLDPITGTSVAYTFQGAGSLIEISPIPSVAGLTVQSVSIRLSQIDQRVNDLLRGYNVRGAPVTIWRGYMDPTSREFTDPAGVMFHGILDHIDVETPSVGGVGFIAVEVVSDTSELTRANSETRSSASQRLRSATDTFYDDTAVVGNWDINWGGEKKKIGALDRLTR